jgi:diacylglycerol kinase family enzyme
VFSKVLRPILEDAAGMEVTAVQLQRPEHATELAAQLDLSSTDTLMCLGGDGTLWEALQVGARLLAAEDNACLSVQSHGQLDRTGITLASCCQL